MEETADCRLQIADTAFYGRQYGRWQMADAHAHSQSVSRMYIYTPFAI
jgi:hypothetical protein